MVSHYLPNQPKPSLYITSKHVNLSVFHQSEVKRNIQRQGRLLQFISPLSPPPPSRSLTDHDACRRRCQPPDQMVARWCAQASHLLNVNVAAVCNSHVASLRVPRTVLPTTAYGVTPSTAVVMITAAHEDAPPARLRTGCAFAQYPTPDRVQVSVSS